MISPNTPRLALYTIGHSDHEIDKFAGLLTTHGITAVADVRSHPYSRYHGQFNREPLAESLRVFGVQYVFLGTELGARRTEAESYVGGQARYDRIRNLPAFQEGLVRLRRGLATHRIAVMCAEKDPITCHRMILICRELRNDAIDVIHVREDGRLELNADAEKRLLDAVGLPEVDLFHSREELVERAYDMQAERIAYTEADTATATPGN